jgi:hypothetical protein
VADGVRQSANAGAAYLSTTLVFVFVIGVEVVLVVDSLGMGGYRYLSIDLKNYGECV